MGVFGERGRDEFDGKITFLWIFVELSLRYILKNFEIYFFNVKYITLLTVFKIYFI